jgi:ATP-dependent Zn protease
LEGPESLYKITITPRTKALGFTQLDKEQEQLKSRASLINAIRVSLGGTLAEEVFFGINSTGR